MSRNYNSISPSAKSLLRMKGRTPIPFAKEAAELLLTDEESAGLEDMTSQLGYWFRVAHFEERYRSIDQLLKDSEIKNLLELSSGFSFRGLYMALHQQVHYIDTDLPDLIKQKQEFIKDLLPDPAALKGVLETLPLNALDEQAFADIISRFGDGALAIVNEGLLMYLGMEEKKKLCSIIHKVLKAKGGYWITADIYIKIPEATRSMMQYSERESHFFEVHNIEDNKFDSFEYAETFFKEQGFILDKEAEPKYDALSSYQRIKDLLPPDFDNAKAQQMGKMRATWLLKAI